MDIKEREIEITDLAFDGKSVGHMDGKVVFLKGGLPGETVLAEITREKPRYNEGIVRKVIKKSDKRVNAPCPHFDICGGCTWQDLTYGDQLQFKTKQVKDCVERIGGLDEVKIHDIIGSVELFQYRNKMEFSYNVNEDESFSLGLHERGSFSNIFNLDKCYITSEVTSDIVRWMRDYVKRENIPVYDVKNHHGYLRFLMLRQAKRKTGLMVNVVTNYGEFPKREQFIKEITTAFPQITTIVHNENGQKSNIATGEIEQILYGSGYIEEQLFESIFKIRANSFFQTNSLQTETLYRTGFEMLEPQKQDQVLDLYCGTGTIGILLSKFVKKVIGVELVADAVKAAEENANVNNVENIVFYKGLVKEFLKTTKEPLQEFNIVIVDPPRAGLNPKALKELVKIMPEKILYISCNPATFARDAKKLIESGYRLPEIRPVDMFPHTMHIELVSVFYRN